MTRMVSLLIVLAAVVIAALLVKPNVADAQGGYCPDSGIVPDSAFVVSTTNQAGAEAGHKVWFQLCRPLLVEPRGEVDAPRLYRIVLIWKDGRSYLDRGFYLKDRETAGITLRILGGDKLWAANTEYSGGACCIGSHGRGIAVDFNASTLNEDIPASMASPLTLQFEIPVAAGMINPLKQGKSRWEIITIYDHGSYCSTYTEEFSSMMLEVASGEIHLSDSYVLGPGSIELSGVGFKPLSPVQSVKVGGIDVKPRHKVSTDDEGKFNLEIYIPHLGPGEHPILLQVGGVTVATKFTARHYGWGPSIDPVDNGLQNLGDNFVVVFNFNSYNCHWSFYDPDIPESDLSHVIGGETYWLLVKEPQEVILNRETRNLTCTPEGNCWNLIVW